MNLTKKIEFTNEAVDQINKITSIKENSKYFRITVKGGGCSGFKYDFSFDNKIKVDDVLFDKTLIDKSSLDIIDGSIIDYKKEMIGDSFVIKNPKVSSSCGCGLSFSI
jgi:iron-sulfur cluster assembly accessory protein|tara:strand:- start:326 stop:649 length:324 start_codon:yes stop_codon:yes gene_type:complete